MIPFYERRLGFVVRTTDGWVKEAALDTKKFTLTDRHDLRGKFSFLDASAIVRELQAQNVSCHVVNLQSGVAIHVFWEPTRLLPSDPWNGR